MKCNIDGVWFQQENQFGIGMCLRDHLGSFISAKTTWLHGYLKPQEIKAFGLLEALRWLQHMGIQQVVSVFFINFITVPSVLLGDKIIVLLILLVGRINVLLVPKFIS